MTSPSFSPMKPPWARLVALATLVAGIIAAAACSSGSDLPPGMGGSGAIGGRGIEAGPCADGATEKCGVLIGKQNGVITCYEGTRSCTAGTWGNCTNGTTQQRSVPTGDGTHLQSIGDASPCLDNPCDPYCWNYPDEQPEGGLGAADGATPTFGWSGGGISLVPSTNVNRALVQPCESGNDCQFDYQCTNVATNSACLHDKCIAGGALSTTCGDTCVNLICQKDSTCCTNGCLHDICQTGTKLDASCSTCVAAICAANPGCCNSSWDSSCVNLITSTAACAPLSCACRSDEITNNGHCYYQDTSAEQRDAARTTCQGRGTGWDLVSIGDATENAFVRSQINQTNWIGYNDRAVEGTWVWDNGDSSTYTNWAGNPDGSGACVKINLSGKWDDTDCATTKPYICEGPTTVCPPGWSANGTSCYWVNPTTINTYSNAEAACVTNGGHLVHINDATENAYVLGLTSGAARYWIGLNDSAAENTFVWTDGAALGGYTNWAGVGGTPTSANNSNSNDCVEFDDATGLWTVVRCSGGAAPWLKSVCEAAQSAPKCWNAADVQYGTDCYRPSGATSVNWTTAQASCRAIGSGWDLVTIDDSAEDTFVTGLLSGSTWIGLNDIAVTGTFVWSNGSTSTYIVWDIAEPNGGTGDNCAKLLYDPTGFSDAKWADADCDGTGQASFGAICEGPKTSTGAIWDQHCIDMIPGVCDASCGTASGTCEPWNAGGIQETCNGVNLTVGIPCTGELVPICNRGTQTAPSGIPIVWYSANSGYYPKCAPDVNAAARLDADSCKTNATIPPGQCITVHCAQLTNTSEIMVNPAGVAGHVDECSSGACLDNWSLYDSSVSCSNATCQGALDISFASGACAITLPSTTFYNPTNVAVTYTASGGTPTAIAQVSAAANCTGDGWYFDSNTAPTTLTLCPTTCSTYQGNVGSSVRAALGCPVTLLPASYTYQYEGICPINSGPQWAFFTYDTDTPSDSSVSFSVRAGNTLADLAAASFKNLATAPPGPDVCPLTGVTGCPIDLYATLGPDAMLHYVELQVGVNPSSNGWYSPVVNAWTITYSCQFNQ